MDATGARIDAVATWVGEALSLGQPSAGPSPKDIEAAAVIGHLAYSEDQGQRALGLAAIKSAADGDYNTARVFLGAAAERNPDDPGLQSAISFLEGKQQIQNGPLAGAGAAAATPARDNAAGAAPTGAGALALMGRGLLAEGAGQEAEAAAYWARMADLHGQDPTVAQAVEDARSRLLQ
jgi:hypothetical protein